MLLDSLADGDAASYHRFIISKVQDEQVSFVCEHSRDSKSTLLSNATICQVQIGQCLIVLDTLCKQGSTV